jgi:hypothetical protein
MNSFGLDFGQSRRHHSTILRTLFGVRTEDLKKLHNEHLHMYL